MARPQPLHREACHKAFGAVACCWHIIHLPTLFMLAVCRLLTRRTASFVPHWSWTASSLSTVSSAMKRSADTMEDPASGPTKPTDSAAMDTSTAASASTDEADMNVKPSSPEFTSEIFKLEVGNMPQHTTPKELRNLLAKNNHPPVKVKKLPRRQTAYVTFRDNEQRDKAAAFLREATFRGKTLTVQLASARLPKDRENKRAKLDPSIPISEHLADKVTALWRLPYEDQLKKKNRQMRQSIVKIGKELLKLSAVPQWVRDALKENSGLPCQFESIIASPVTEKYRSKCDFTIGFSPGPDKEPTVGFNFAGFADGVAEVDDCLVVPDASKAICKAFQEFVRAKREYTPWNPVSHEGLLKSVVVRTPRAGGAVATLMVNAGGVPKETLDSLAEDLRTFMQQKVEAGLNLSSLLTCEVINVKGQTPAAPVNRLLFGDSTVTEEMMGLKFRISPSAFFQVNTPGAEVLFGKVKEWCQLGAEQADNTILLDICCGTGTIGQCLSEGCKQIVGFELCEEAVVDARANAELNGITKAKYFVGKAEDTMPHYEHVCLRNETDANIVGIVDPPRAGLHTKVITTIRKCENLKRLVYVSCNINSASGNVVEPISKKYHGKPFRLVRAVPVDMFPQTPHCEMILLLERD